MVSNEGAVSAPDRFVAPYILDMLGDAAVEIPPEAMEDQMTLDALLTSCNAIVHDKFQTDRHYFRK